MTKTHTAAIAIVTDHEFDGTPGEWSVELVEDNEFLATVAQGDDGNYPGPYELDGIVTDWARTHGYDVEGFEWTDDGSHPGTRTVTLSK